MVPDQFDAFVVRSYLKEPGRFNCESIAIFHPTSLVIMFCCQAFHMGFSNRHRHRTTWKRDLILLNRVTVRLNICSAQQGYNQSLAFSSS